MVQLVSSNFKGRQDPEFLGRGSSVCPTTGLVAAFCDLIWEKVFPSVIFQAPAWTNHFSAYWPRIPILNLGYFLK